MNLLLQIPVLFSLLLFVGFDSSQFQNKSAKQTEPSLSVKSYSIEKYDLILQLELTNPSDEAISILKPRPIVIGRNIISTVPPDFFNVQFINQEQACIMSEPFNSGSKFIKTKDDILIVEAKSVAVFDLNCSHYDMYFCEEEMLEIEVKYSFDQSLLDKENFQNTIAKKGKLTSEQSEQLYELISTTYQKPLTANWTLKK